MIISEADSTNNLTSVSRKLDQKLVLLVKQKLGETDHWMMPQRPRKEGESMRQVGAKGSSHKLANSNKRIVNLQVDGRPAAIMFRKDKSTVQWCHL